MYENQDREGSGDEPAKETVQVKKAEETTLSQGRNIVIQVKE